MITCEQIGFCALHCALCIVRVRVRVGVGVGVGVCSFVWFVCLLFVRLKYEQSLGVG